MRRRVEVALVIACACVWALVVWWRGRVEFDDAFIPYRYAWNLAHGHGLVFNPGEHVEGYTDFLWVLLAAGAIKVHLDPFWVTRAIGVASYVATVGAAGWWLARLSPHLLSALALLVLPTGLAEMAGTGLETAFVAALMLAVGLTQHVLPYRRWFAVVPLLACLTRLDAGIAVAASLVVSRKWRRFVPTAVGMIVWFVWRRLYYGDFLPNSYYAKAAYLWSWKAGSLYLWTFVRSYPHVWPLAVALLAAPIVAWRTPWRDFAAFAALATVGFAVYIAKVGGDFMHYRFAFEIYPVAVCGAAVALARLPAVAQSPVALACALLAVQPVLLEGRFGMQSLGEMDGYARAGHEVGQALRRALPPDTIIATTLAGTMSYESRLTTIDQWGLNDRTVGHQPVDRITGRGHVKFAPESYLRARGVNLYIAHPVVCSCRFPCIEDKPNIFVRVAGDRCLRSWYFVQSPELTRWVCSHPDDFVLNRVDCGSEPGPRAQSSTALPGRGRLPARAMR